MAEIKYTGKNLLVSWNGAVLTANTVKKVTIGSTKDLSESTGSSDADKTYLPTLRDADITLELWDTATDATSAAGSSASTATFRLFNDSYTGTGTGSAGSAAMIIYPNGSAGSAARKISCSPFVTSIDQGYSYNETVPLTVKLKANGGVTYGIVP